MPERGQQRKPEAANMNEQTRETTEGTQPREREVFLTDIKEAWGFDPDQVLDILGVTMDRLGTLARDDQNRAWAKLKETHEGLPF
jgi:hypothetical protein